jgi:hypothetical protein
VTEPSELLGPLTFLRDRYVAKGMDSGAMTRLLGRAWVPLVMVIVVALGAFAVDRLHGIFGSQMYTPDSANADAIVQFNAKRAVRAPPNRLVPHDPTPRALRRTAHDPRTILELIVGLSIPTTVGSRIAI